MKIVNRINRVISNAAARIPETKDQLFILNVIPTSINRMEDHIQIIGYQYGQSYEEQYNIDKLYFTNEVDSTIAEGIAKNQPIRIVCVQYRKFNNKISKMYNTWKVIQIQEGYNSHDWVQLDNHSKLFEEHREINDFNKKRS